MNRTKIFLAAILLAGAPAALISCKKEAAPAVAAEAKFHCPMHPTYTSDKPGDCPICGMRLVPIEAAPAPAGAAPSHEGHLADRAAIQLPPEREQMIGVRTQPVRTVALKSEIRASGQVAYDPELFNAVVEYREALKSRERIKDSPWNDVRERSESLIRASMVRLRQMGLSDDIIKRLAAADTDPNNLLLGGPGGKVWIYAQVYEYEMAAVKAGQAMRVTSASLPGRAFSGRIASVDGIIDPNTRTLRVRGEVENKEGLLRPQMYVDVEISADLGKRLAVPKEAILNTGTRRLAFVAKGNGVYEPRELVLGREAADAVEVVSGLSEGENVVTSANFLIDSESRMKSALSPAAGGHAGHGDAR